jgi:REP element-mobilizing transposase RayT
LDFDTLPRGILPIFYMDDLPEERGRNRPPHFPPIEKGNFPAIVFLTVCTKDRQPVLATEGFHHLLKDAWKSVDLWLVGRYVILPDHIHLFCAANTDGCSLEAWVQCWKSYVARRSPEGTKLWQRAFWDTQLRTGESYSVKWDYIRNNPVRHGLATDANGWPYQGEVNFLPWYS